MNPCDKPARRDANEISIGSQFPICLDFEKREI